MRYSKLGIALVLLCITSTLGGCDKTVAKQKKEIEGLTTQVVALKKTNTRLQNDLDNMSITEVTPETSLKEVEGSQVPVFETIDGKIKFPNSLTLPSTFQDVNSSYMMVGSRFRFVPSNNWLVKSNGTTLELSHPSKIWGSIKAIGVEEVILETDMQGYIRGFFEGFPKTTITYRKTFIEDRVTGLIGTGTITVDKKPYVINVGFVERGENGVLFLFAYEDDKSGVQQELINLLITSGQYGDSKILLE